MKKIFVVIAVIVAQSCAIFQSKIIAVTGFIESNSAYLGGTPPRKGMEEALAIYKPAINEEFFIKKDSVTLKKDVVLMQFKTNKEGKYAISLPIGIYSIFRKQKIEYAKIAKNNEPCDWVELPDFILIIDNNKNYKSKYTIDRNPCGPQIQ